MKVLVAEDDPIIRRLLEVTLSRAGHEVTPAADGAEAWRILQRPDAPRLAILDWMMPEVDGLDLCRRIRASEGKDYVYVIMLTARGRKEDLLEGLAAGADDYLVKPFDPQELRGRLQAGVRVLGLELALKAKVGELEAALAQVERLQGLLPICMHCKRIRDEQEIWHRIETYISEHSEAEFTHSLCDDCREKYYPATEPAGAPPAR
jgi:DNA-binding response OmpR family regulator